MTSLRAFSVVTFACALFLTTAVLAGGCGRVDLLADLPADAGIDGALADGASGDATQGDSSGDGALLDGGGGDGGDGGSCTKGRVCSGVCVDTTSDPKNCGGCAIACGVNQVCSAGV